LDHNYYHVRKYCYGRERGGTRFEGIRKCREVGCGSSPHRRLARRTFFEFLSVSCDYIEDNLRARSRADAYNPMLEDFGLEPKSYSQLQNARALP